MAKRFIVWIVDVEFYVISGHNVVPWELVIRDGSTGKIVLSTLVDYGMGIQDVMDDLGRPSLQPIHFGYLIKHCTDLGNLSLGYVHRSLFDKNLEMHDAGNDTLAMYDIYQWFLTNTRDW
ncbi:hypothetical protein J4E86_001511 [Alternaria arbusti]|uniref:uncharacterized protein n=1 Tax=Alternaria arbusti TaxID=232088 RepID=UPI002220E444|nr:uncharacterized protein J4E86_001511 [Alternaria arbusti]KAI4962476.1 hypothetical protein J4E86_001511 [Alternaria arbusti]